MGVQGSWERVWKMVLEFEYRSEGVQERDEGLIGELGVGARM